jgi:hypothetical protein
VRGGPEFDHNSQKSPTFGKLGRARISLLFRDVHESVDHQEFLDLFCTCAIAQMGHSRQILPEVIRDKDMLLMIDGEKNRLNLNAGLIFWLNRIDMLVVPEDSSHLPQIFDVALA